MKKVSLGKVCDLFTGGTPSKQKLEYFQNGEIKWLVSGDINQREIFNCEGRITQDGLKNSNAKFLPLDSVLIALNGQGKTRGTVALLRTNATCNQSLVAISPKDKAKFDTKFIFYVLDGMYQEIRKLTGDGGNERRGLNMRIIGNIKIPLLPLAEQRSIVEMLDEIYKEIDKLVESINSGLKAITDLMTVYIEKSYLGNFTNYEMTTVGESCEFYNGKPHEKAIDNNGNYCVINSKFISSDGVTQKYTNKQLFPLFAGDIVFVMSDVPNGKALAKTFLVDCDEKYSLNQRICCIRSKKYEPRFLQSLLDRNSYFLKFDNGENQTNLRKSNIVDFPLPIVSLDEQLSFIEKYEKNILNFIMLKQIYLKKLLNLQALKKNILFQQLS